MRTHAAKAASRGQMFGSFRSVSWRPFACAHKRFSNLRLGKCVSAHARKTVRAWLEFRCTFLTVQVRVYSGMNSALIQTSLVVRKAFREICFWSDNWFCFFYHWEALKASLLLSDFKLECKALKLLHFLKYLRTCFRFGSVIKEEGDPINGAA